MSDLEVRGVTYVVGRTLLDDVTLTFRGGEVCAVSGPSGSGKTTLLSIAGGLVEPTSGSTEYPAGPDARSKGTSMWQGTGDPRPEVAFVLQVYGLVPILSARENVSIALRARGVAPAEADELAEAALARFHIADLGDRQVEELSGGQMQRVACARGFVVGADILLADEPTSELDEGNRSLVLEELRAEAERGAVVVVATHDPAVVDACDRHYALDEGVLVEHVPPRTRRAQGSAAREPAPVAQAPAAAAVSAPAVGAPAVEAPAVGEPPRHRQEQPFETPRPSAPQEPPARSPFARPVDQ